MKYLLTMICLLATFSSCSNDKNDEPEAPRGRTVLVYISAENTLSNYVDENISQMVKGSATLSPENHLIAFVDKASANEMPYIIEIAGGGQKTVKTFAGDICAGDPREMRDIIKWTASNYPAKDYGLILWGHASGWLIEDSVSTSPAASRPKRAFGIDNGTNNPGSDMGKWMNTPSMAKYIAESGIKFKYIFADVCCFQNVENAYELRNVTDYLIGSPAEIPADGAPYDAIMPYLFSTAPDFYKGIIDEYEKYYAGRSYYGETFSVPLSAAKTAEAVPLAQAATRMWSVMPPAGNISTEDVIYYFSRYSVTGKGYDRNKIFYDAYDMIYANTGKQQSDTWRNALNRMVVYSSFNTSRHWMSAGHVSFSDFTVTPERISCISMFVPLSIYDSGAAQYNEMIKHMSWYYASGLYNLR